MIKTLIFDFGNVIGFFDHRLASSRLAEQAGVAVEEMHVFLWDGPLEDDYEAGRISTAEFLRQIRERWQIGCADEVLGAAYADIFHTANAELIALLPALKPQHRLLLASNTNEL